MPILSALQGLCDGEQGAGFVNVPTQWVCDCWFCGFGQYSVWRPIMRSESIGGSANLLFPRVHLTCFTEAMRLLTVVSRGDIAGFLVKRCPSGHWVQKRNILFDGVAWRPCWILRISEYLIVIRLDHGAYLCIMIIVAASKLALESHHDRQGHVCVSTVPKHRSRSPRMTFSG